MIRIDKELLKEIREMPCAWCNASPPSDPHHLFPRQMGGGNRLDIRLDLVPLCRTCHTKAENCELGESPRKCRCILALRILQREMSQIRRMPKEAAERFGKIMDDLNQLMRDYP
jgi:hypothetical protein